jgi:hypothetical protein
MEKMRVQNHSYWKSPGVHHILQKNHLSAWTPSIINMCKLYMLEYYGDKPLCQVLTLQTFDHLKDLCVDRIVIGLVSSCWNVYGTIFCKNVLL